MKLQSQRYMNIPKILFINTSIKTEKIRSISPSKD